MGYITSARARAGRRRSRWNLLLIPCYFVTWFALVMVSFVALGALYARMHPAVPFRILPDTVGGILMAVGSLFAWLGPAMMLANVMVASVRPARRALDHEAAAVPGTDRASANRDLGRVSRILTPIGIVVALAGMFIPG